MENYDFKPKEIIKAMFEFIIIPDYIHNYLSRKGIGVDFTLDKLVLDQNLTTQDIGVIMYLNGFEFSNLLGKSVWLNNWTTNERITSLKPKSDLVFATKIQTAQTLSSGNSVRKEVATLLNSVCNETDSSYKLVTTGTKIWLILKTGFLAMFKNPQLRLQFYRDYLKAVGEIAPFRYVAETSVFSLYVDELLG